MPGIILQCTALKIVNKGGGHVTKTVVEEKENKLGIKLRTHRHFRSNKKMPGSDYVVFECPGCGTRNKRSIYDVKGRAGDSLSFVCHGCYKEIEVSRPKTSSILGPDGKSLAIR